MPIEAVMGNTAVSSPVSRPPEVAADAAVETPGKGLYPARSNVRQDRLDRIEHDADLSADQVRHSRRAALVGHVHERGCRGALEHLTGEMTGRAAAGGAEGELTGLRSNKRTSSSN